MDTEITTPEAAAPVVTAEAPAPVEATAPKAKRPARTKAAAKPAAKPAVKANAKATPAKAARTPIPEGMTRSRGALIPSSQRDAKGNVVNCAFTGAKGQCGNPGRWTVTPENALSCTTHKNAAKRTLFAPPAKKRASRSKAAAAA